MPERELSANGNFNSLHDAARSTLAGTQLDSGKFVSFEIELQNGIKYVVISLTAYDIGTNLPEGLYILTTIPQGFSNKITDIATPIVQSLIHTVLRPTQQEDYVDIPAEINPFLSAMGTKVNMNKTIGVSILGYMKNGMLLRIEQLGIDRLKNLGLFDAQTPLT